MYHISGDKRVLRSAELICEGMLACLEKKELSEITVTDLWKTSGVSRATFYRLFDNVLDVVIYQCEQVIALIVEELWELPPEKRSYRTMTISILDAAMLQHGLLSAVSRSNRLDIVYGALKKQIPTLLRLYTADADSGEEAGIYFLNCVCSLISTVIDLWAQQGQIKSADELYEQFVRVVHLLDANFGR